MANGIMRRMAVLNPSDIREEEVETVENALDHMLAESQNGNGELVNFVVHILESLKQGHEVALYAAEEV